MVEFMSVATNLLNGYILSKGSFCREKSMEYLPAGRKKAESYQAMLVF